MIKSKQPVGIIIQARMGSTRLPEKVLKPLADKPALEILIQRLSKSRLADIIIVATTVNQKDDVLFEFCQKKNIACVRGSEDDVLSRYYETVRKYALKTIVRITADCPLMDPCLVDKLILTYLESNNVDYVSNTLSRTFPRGFDIEVFSRNGLEEAFEKAMQPYEREHVTPYFHSHLQTLNVAAEGNNSQYRVTIDTVEDYEVVSKVYIGLMNTPDFGVREVVDWLGQHPEIAELNKHIEQKKI